MSGHCDQIDRLHSLTRVLHPEWNLLEKSLTGLFQIRIDLKCEGFLMKIGKPHGLSNTGLYEIFNGMISRCENFDVPHGKPV